MTSTTITAPAVPKDLLSIADLDTGQLTGLLDLAAEMKADPKGWLGAHPGELVACYFSKPSTRTRVSFEGASLPVGDAAGDVATRRAAAGTR